MFDYVCSILIDFTHLFVPLIFFRIVFDTFRDFVFKN